MTFHITLKHFVKLILESRVSKSQIRLRLSKKKSLKI